MDKKIKKVKKMMDAGMSGLIKMDKKLDKACPSREKMPKKAKKKK